MIVYKLTHQNMTTFRGYAWQLGKKQRPLGPVGNTMCLPGILHAYRGPEMALLCNGAHAVIVRPRLFMAHTPRVVADDGAKIGVHELTLVRELAVPQWKYGAVHARLATLVTAAERAFLDAADEVDSRMKPSYSHTALMLARYRGFASFAHDLDDELATELLPPGADLAMQAVMDVTGDYIHTEITKP